MKEEKVREIDGEDLKEIIKEQNEKETKHLIIDKIDSGHIITDVINDDTESKIYACETIESVLKKVKELLK